LQLLIYFGPGHLPDDPLLFTSFLKENRVFFPQKSFSEKAYIRDMQEYEQIYSRSIQNPEEFWAEKALQLVKAIHGLV